MRVRQAEHRLLGGGACEGWDPCVPRHVVPTNWSCKYDHMTTTARRQGRGRTVLKAADFKARALAVMRRVHATGESVTVTSHGRPLVRIEPIRGEGEPLGYGCMRGTFALLVPEDEARGAPAASWGTLREWREMQKR
jgi:prevent-host-death family protein